MPTEQRERIVGEQRTCIFCGGSARPSNEHVLPRWLWRDLHGSDDRTTPIASDDPAFWGEQIEFVPDGLIRGWEPMDGRPSIKAHRLTVNRVCVDCNNGWMSQLEDRTRLIFARLWSRRFWRLTATEVHNLRRWAIKTTLVHDLTVPQPLGTLAMTSAVYGDQEPPGTWYVGLVRCAKARGIDLHLSTLASGIRPDTHGEDSSLRRVVNNIATEHVIIAGGWVLIVRFSPYPVRPPASLEHDLNGHPAGTPVRVAPSMAGRRYDRREVPNFQLPALDDLQSWGHSTPYSRGGAPMVLAEDERGKAIFSIRLVDLDRVTFPEVGSMEAL